jgi:hypothetical protein
MSIHPNADDSQTDGVKVEPWGKFVSHQLALSALHAWRHHPTTTSGFLIPAGTSITLSAADAAARPQRSGASRVWFA